MGDVDLYFIFRFPKNYGQTEGRLHAGYTIGYLDMKEKLAIGVSMLPVVVQA